VLAGRYELGQRLGSGGMATVYEAHDQLLDRPVAVKLLRSDALSAHTARQRFAAEARAAASLTHPHAVAVYDVSSTDEQPFIVMELVRGSTLEDVLNDKGRLDETQAIAVGSQILAALHAAHRRGLVHRDVKPANILLPDGIVPTRPEELPGVKLADFGIAKAATDATVGLTTVGQVIGTPKYLSPEQVKGERATPQSDLYATGVVLYEMLAGRPPFERDSALGLALAHREDEPPPLSDLRSDLNPALVALVHRALSKNPADRPSDANEMRDALIATADAPRGTRLLEGAAASTEVVPPAGPLGPTEPVGPTPTTVAAPPPPRRMWWLAVLTLLVVLGALAALWLARTAGTDPDESTPGADQTAAPEQPAGGGDPAPGQDAAPDEDTAPDQDTAPASEQEPPPEEEEPGANPALPEEEDPPPDEEEPLPDAEPSG
jgi:tRNA A-37 threonylcarbamoyl transferase component Bud32